MSQAGKRSGTQFFVTGVLGNVVLDCCFPSVVMVHRLVNHVPIGLGAASEIHGFMECPVYLP
jgi:hypothetical protein